MDDDDGWGADPSPAESFGDDGGWGAEPVVATPADGVQVPPAGPSALEAEQNEAFFKEIGDLVFSGDPVVIISAKPGTGKSTRLPIYLALQFDGHVVVTEPRVVAVDKLYARVLELKHNGRADIEVLRCTRRNDDIQGACRRGAKPRVVFATDGKVVNRSFHSTVFGVFEDQRANFKSFLIIDEIHEMNLNMEICLSKAREYISALHAVNQGHEFQLFIISATINEIGEIYQSIVQFFSRYGVIPRLTNFEHEMPFESHIEYSGEEMTIARKDDEFSICYRVERKVDEIRKHYPDAGILIFVSSMAIAQAMKGRLVHLYKHRPDEQKVHIVFRATSTPMRDEAFGRGDCKTIICSNIAEPSLTIEDIDFVIDTGTVRRSRNFYELDTLYEEPISQAEAIHRAGRVGRLRSGRVIRMYTQKEYEQFKIDPPSQSSREDARMVAAAFCSKLEIPTVSVSILKEKMVISHEGMCDEVLGELANIGLMDVDNYGNYAVNMELMNTFVRQSSSFVGSYVGMMLLTFNSLYYEPYVAAQALLNAPNFWMNLASTEMFPESQRPRASEKLLFNDNFSEMTTILQVYHKYLRAPNGRTFCKDYGIYTDAIYDAELQFQSVVGKSMRMCTNLERAYRNKEDFRKEVAPHMYCATLDPISRKYKVNNVPYFADLKETDAVYARNGENRHTKIYCDGIISTSPGKHYLVNTMLHDRDDEEEHEEPVEEEQVPPLDASLNPEWY